LGFEEVLWRAADKRRHNMDATKYKHVVLGRIFLNYISDAFSERHEALKWDKNADSEDRGNYFVDKRKVHFYNESKLRNLSPEGDTCFF